jgi:proto-oncogene C-crk
MSHNLEDDTTVEITFDPNDEVSYYYGNLNRDEVKDVLLEASIGTFLIRDSTKDDGQNVLCVKEATKCINNYKIIHKITESSSPSTLSKNEFFLYGKEDLVFTSIPSILEFYSTHYLNQSSLVKPAFYHKKVLTLFDFLESDDPNEDLYFRASEILTIIEYTQGGDWWKAINQLGATGLIPATLVRRLKPNEWPSIRNNLLKSNKNVKSTANDIANEPIIEEIITNENDVPPKESTNQEFRARVVEDYTPSPYEHSHLSLRKGQIITVLEMKSEGKWLGQYINSVDCKRGLFPFNRVEIIDS